MSVLTTIAAFQALHADIAGVKTAPTAIKGQIDSVDCPVVYVWPSETVGRNWQPQASSWRIVDRDYLISVFVQPVAKGRGVDEGYQKAITMLQAFGEMYTTDTALRLDGSVAHISNIRDSGVGVVEYAGVKFHGFEFRIAVTEKEAV